MKVVKELNSPDIRQLLPNTCINKNVLFQYKTCTCKSRTTYVKKKTKTNGSLNMNLKFKWR